MRYRIKSINLDIGPNEGFRDANGTSYPPNWTSLVSHEEMQAIGMEVYEVVVPPPVPAPLSVTSLQAFLALADANLLETVETAVQNHPVKEVTIWFEKTTTWREDDPYVQAIGAELGLTDEQIHNLFVAASLK